MVHECVPIGASIRASRASWDYSRASAQLCRSQQQHGLGVERAYTSRIPTQYKTIPRHLSTEAIQAVVYAFAKIHKRLARVPLPQLHMYAHRYRQAHPSVRCESAHCVAHVLCRSNKARKHFSQHMSFLGTTCVQEPSADPAKPLNCHLFSLRR